MKKEQGNCRANFQGVQAGSPKNSAQETIIIVGIIAIVTVMLGFLATSIFTNDQMYIIQPLLVAAAIFVTFSYILRIRVHANLLGEIGFIYLTFALAYTILPAIKFFALDLNIPLDFDRLNFAVLSPQPEELGTHFWRHVLFISGVAVGFLAVRGRSALQGPLNEKSESRNGRIITIILAIIVFCLCGVTLLSAPVTGYLEHYTRFDHLSWPLRKFVDLILLLKIGCYFVILSLMFNQYRKYRTLIFIVVPLVCVYELVYSSGSRITAFIILLAFLGFYHFRVNFISMKKGIVFLLVVAVVFSGVSIIRSSINYLEAAQTVIKDNKIKSGESEAVYCTSFHLYSERSNGTLPPRDWKMFFYDFTALIPFVDHEENRPQFWYARNYFPEVDIPPTSFGVIADSAIWGGEFDLLVRSVISGAFFALLTRWFLYRREKWWALTIYIYCYATCVMVLKYSVFFQLTPLVRELIPVLLLTEGLLMLQNDPSRWQSFFAKPSV